MRRVRRMRLLGGRVSWRVRLRLGGRDGGLRLILGGGVLGLGWGSRERGGGVWDLGGVRRLGLLDLWVRKGDGWLGLHGGRDGN